MEYRMPERVNLGKSYNSVLGAPIMQRGSTDEDPTYWNPLDRPTVMGYVIPEWQRPLVWSQAQSIKFIESIWLGLPLGTYTINIDTGSNDEPTRNIIIDGQQRMNAIEEYLEGKFPVFGKFHADLNDVELRVFAMTGFCSLETASSDMEYLKSYYNLMNFGGTNHTEEQRA